MSFFEYNEDGLRMKKTATSTGTTECTLHGKNIVHMTRGSDSLHFLYDAQGKPAEVIYNGVAYRYLYNLQGDVVALIDGAGAKVVEYSYDAWGEPTGKTRSLASTLGTAQPFRYRGYVWDEETGLYYLRSRYYRPEWCRLLSADKLIKGNLYCYCENNPTNLADLNGLEAVAASSGFIAFETAGTVGADIVLSPFLSFLLIPILVFWPSTTCDDSYIFKDNYIYEGLEITLPSEMIDWGTLKKSNHILHGSRNQGVYIRNNCGIKQ